MYDAFASQLQQNILRLLSCLEAEYNESTIDSKDYTIYTGTTGMSMFYVYSLDGHACLIDNKNIFIDIVYEYIIISIFTIIITGIRLVRNNIICQPHYSNVTYIIFIIILNK